MVKAYHWVTQLFCDEGFTQTILLVVITAIIFALIFNASFEIVVGMIVVGSITALLEHRLDPWSTNEREGGIGGHGRQ